MSEIPRRKGERVVIGDGIEIEIVEISGEKVELGVEVPLGVPVRRKEFRRTLGGDDVEEDQDEDPS